MSEHQKTTQATLSTQGEIKEHQTVERFALFLADGTPLTEVLDDLESRLSALEP
jgi:hypothetical protein